MAKKKIPELKIEHVHERGNLLYLALIEYKREEYLCVIDNVSTSSIGAYILDYVEQEEIPINEFLGLVTRWFYGNSDKHPLSVELARAGLTERLAPIYRTFDTAYVARIVGNAFVFDELNTSRVRRRRVNPIPEGVAIRLKKQPQES